MSLGDLLSSLAGRIVREAAGDAALRGVADHINHRKPGEAPPTSVHNGWATRTVGVASCAVMIALAAFVMWSIVIGRPIDGAWVAGPFFSAVAIWLCISTYDAFVRRVEWNDTDVRFRSWTGERIVRWEDIVNAEDRSHPPHVRIGFRDGTGFGISETMRGSRYFLDLVGGRLRPDDPGSGKRHRRRQRGKKA